MLLHHYSNFRAWTSISSNSWNAQQQGGLSSDFNSSQPSWLHPRDSDTWSASLSGPDGTSLPTHHSLNPGSQETGSYVKIGSASWRSYCSQGFWKQSTCCWQVLRSFWPYYCPESSSLPEQMPSTFPVPFRSLGLRTLDLWWAAGSEDRQRCQLSTSPWSILEKPGTSKWSSHHPCPEPWWTARLSRAWCAAVEEYSVSVHQRVVDDIPFFARHQFLPQRPVLLRVMLSMVSTIPHAQKTWFYDFKLIPFRHNHPELSDLNISYQNNHFQSKQLFDMAFYPHQLLLKCSTYAYMWTKT